MVLKKHLELLKDRKLINDTLIEIMLKIENRLITFWCVDVTTTQVEMGLVHLAMALGRIKRGCAALPLNKDMFAEIKSAVCFPQVLRIHTDILTLIPFTVPESEQTHLIANWYSLILAQPWVLGER